jgi:hypothetical protein
MAARKETTTAKPKGPVYRALRPLVVAGKQYKIGDVVPDALKWPRLESWVRARVVELVQE